MKSHKRFCLFKRFAVEILSDKIIHFFQNGEREKFILFITIHKVHEDQISKTKQISSSLILYSFMREIYSELQFSEFSE